MLWDSFLNPPPLAQSLKCEPKKEFEATVQETVGLVAIKL
jgi:hypothetical protein